MKNVTLSYTLSLILIPVLFFSACRKKIDLELDSSYTRLVVEGSISDEMKSHVVHLTLSSDYFSNKPPERVSGAMVEIADGDNVFVLTEVASGIYQTAPNVQGVTGREYTLTVKGVDINGDGETEIFTARDILKPVMVLDSIVVEQQEPFATPPLYKVSGWGREPPTPDDFYQWVYYINGVLQTDTLTKSVFADDTFVNGNYIPGLTMFTNISADPGDTITVETRSVSREYYNFLVSFMLETTWNQGGGAGPPANIKGNISGGALGFFFAHGSSYTSAIIPE